MISAKDPVETGTSRRRLRAVWQRIESGSPTPHTSVVVPSLTFDREELAKIQGVRFYEERLLVALLRLRDPRARLVFVTSEAVHPEIVTYYLNQLPTTARTDAEQRLVMLSAHDTSPRALTEKILERPRLLDRMREAIGERRNAYMTCFNATMLEQRLALELGVPLNGADPRLAWMGTKAGSRQIFRDSGVRMPAGRTGVRTRADLVAALAGLIDEVSEITRVVVKLDDSFAGAGNAIFEVPDTLPGGEARRQISIDSALANLRPASGESPDSYLAKLERMGGIVEQFLDGEDCVSPSVQLRVDPEGNVQILSTHDQVLEGPINQTYVGCRFPAHPDLRGLIVPDAMKVGEALAEAGVVGRFGIDFVVATDPDGARHAYAIEINLRMGGTTFPFMALSSMAPGKLVAETGEYRLRSGERRCYFATDNLRAPRYVGLSPADFFDIMRRNRLHFDSDTYSGPVFFMVGALSELGRLGVTCIGQTYEEADAMYARVVHVLDAECAEGGGWWRAPSHPVGLPIASME